MAAELLWILVSDAGRSRVFERNGARADIVERTDLQMAMDLPKSSDLMTDRLPRTHESAGVSRHAMEPASDPNRELKKQMARQVSAMLLRQVQQGAYDHLVVVAPPAFLGDLRASFDHQVSERVTREFPKDMTKVPAHDLSKRLAELLEA